MELAFLTPLLKNSAESVGGGVAIDDKRFIKLWLSKDRGGANSVDKSVKGRFVFVIPMEFTPLHAVGNKGVKWGGEHTEMMDVHVVKVEKSQKGMEFSQSYGSLPVFDAIYFHWVHGNAILADDNP